MEHAARVHMAELTAIAQHAPKELERIHDSLWERPLPPETDERRAVRESQVTQLMEDYALMQRIERRKRNAEPYGH